MNFGAYWFSDRIVLATYKAQEVDETTHPEFVGLVRELAQNAGLPMPKVYIVPTDTTRSPRAETPNMLLWPLRRASCEFSTARSSPE